MGTEFVDKVREYLLSIGEDAQGVCVIERYLFFFFVVSFSYSFSFTGLVAEQGCGCQILTNCLFNTRY